MPDFLSAVISAAAGLFGVGMGGAIALFNQRRQRADERIQQQLTEFYAPFLGIRMLILAKSEFRVKLSGVLDTAWQQPLARARAQGDPGLLRETADSNWPAFESAQQYSDRVLRDEIVPLYNKMVNLFTDKMWLTEPSTRRHFQTLVEYVEIWNRYFADAIPKQATPLLDHREDKVKPLYEDVANHFEILTQKLK